MLELPIIGAYNIVNAFPMFFFVFFLWRRDFVLSTKRAQLGIVEIRNFDSLCFRHRRQGARATLICSVANHLNISEDGKAFPMMSDGTSHDWQK